MRKQILDLLEGNSKLTPAEIAAMIGADEQEDRDPEFFLISHLSYSFFLKSKYSIPQHYALCKKNLCFLEISACILRRNVYNSICC